MAFLTPQDMERAGRSRPVQVVPLRLAQFALRTIRTDGDFDEREFRRSLQEAAA